MIFVDTNYFLRYLVAPTTPEAEEMQAIATDLIESVERGEEEITTSEVVLHEICYVLSSQAHYKLAPSQIADYLAPIIRMSGFKLPRGEKGLYLRALEIYVAHPKLELEFADTLIAARAERLGVPLATFDKQLGGMPFVTRWPSTGEARSKV